MKHWLALLVCGILCGGLFITVRAQAPDPQAQTPEPPGFDAEAAGAELAALLESELHGRVDTLAPLIFDVSIDHIVYDSDGQIAAIWVAMRDPQTGEIIATEPSLVIARRAALDAAWSLILPPEANYAAELAALPEEVISSELRETFLAQANEETLDSLQAFSGYLLPWAAGKAKTLSGSIGHYLVYNPPSCSEYYCRYAFDFADGTMFPLLASKGGEVYSFYAGCANNDPECTNYFVLKDYSTNPVTYQTYLHLAYDSIPAALRVKGAQVLQGQFIGNVDDTGYSSGHHLHFHVFTTPTGAYWGPSVDITFDDVDINGGRPRTCYEASNWPSLGSECHDKNLFISGNRGAYPPGAQLTLPVHGEVVTDNSLLVAGTATDDLGVTKAQAILKINGIWQLAGPSQVLGGAKSESYVLDVNLCAAGAPNGPLEVAVRVWDYEGNASLDPQSPRTVINNTVCTPPPPACQPGSNQVALYSAPNYTGTCKVLGAGEYKLVSSYAPVPDNSLSSLLVGSDVEAILYDQTDFGGRSETIVQNDPNLADNRLGADRMSSLRVALRTLAIDAPVLNKPFNVAGVALTSVDSLVLDWDAPGAVSFQSALAGPLSLTRDWSDSSAWSVGSLPAGDYTWTAKAKTASGAVVSNTYSFSILAASLPAAPAILVPAAQIEDGSGWAATAAGLWHYAPGYALGGRTVDAWVYNDGADIGSGTVGASDLTSPPFTVPAGPAWLAFDYNTLTESANSYWDQRWVQISVDGGRFVNLLQLSGERMDAWLSSPWIDLSAYAGKSVRLRFHFDIVDKYYNGNLPEGGVARGWVIDNVRIFNDSLPGCAEASNDTPGTATALGMDLTVQGSICPPGDVDFYRFSAAAGQRIGAELFANGAQLEVSLLAPDGRSLLDSGVNSAGLLTPVAGDYYLRVRASDHPGVGGAADTYSLRLTQDLQAPSLTLTVPAGVWLPSYGARLVAQASDVGTGVSRVSFLWHPSDWLNGAWQVLGVDYDGTDGWTWSFDPVALGNIEGSALAAQAYDFAGNSWTEARFGLQLDAIAPVSQLQALPASLNSTALQLQWSASDTGTGLDHFELQVDAGNDGDWQVLDAAVPAGTNRYWFVGQPGATYGFRMRAIDRAGNAEAFPGAAETVTQLAASCTGDDYENGDDAPAGAPGISGNARNLCSGVDPDWVRFTAVEGRNLILLRSLSGGAAFRVSLYAPGDIANPIGVAQSSGVGQSVFLIWTAPAAGEYLMKIESLQVGLFGTDVRYTVGAGEPWVIYFPLVRSD